MATRSKKRRERTRGKRRENRHQRRQEMNRGGGDWDCITIPDGLEVWKPEEGETYHVDIIPYIAGKLNRACDEGDEYFELTYPVYRDLGIEERKYVAIGEFCGDRDPVAEHFMRMRRDGAEWDDMKAFKPTKRQLMLVFVHEEADKGLQLYEGAYGTFGELLDEEIADGSDEEWVENLDDPDSGATVKVRFKGQDIGQKNKWIRASKITLIQRPDGFDADGDDELRDKVLDKASELCLDNLLKLADYDTLKKALEGEPLAEPDDSPGDEAGEDEEKPKATRRRKTKKPDPEEAEEGEQENEPEEEEEQEEDPEPEPEAKPKRKKKAAPAKAKKTPAEQTAELGIVKGGKVEHDEHGECVVVRIAKDGTITLRDEDEELHKGVDPTDVEPMGEDDAGDDAGDDDAGAAESTEKPSKKKTAGAKSATKKGTSPSDGDDDWDDWDD